MNPLFANLETSVFEVMSRLARETGAVNLGQGFPDDPGPADVREAAARAVVEGWNQYPPMMGLPELRHAIAAHYARWQGVALDPEAEVMVTSGATEAIAGALLALIEPGDEVVLFEPMYDAYLPLVRRAGGVPRFVTLAPPAFRLTEEALARAFSPKTKVALFNNPLNPTATIFSDADLALLGRFLHPPRRHRALRRGLGARRLRRPPPQAADRAARHARAHGEDRLGRQDLQPHRLEGRLRLRRRADHARAGEGAPVHHLHDAAEPAGGGRLRARQGRRLFRGHARRLRREAATASRPASPALGFDVIPSQATYFLNIDISPLGEPDDTAFCRRLVLDHGVAAIPVSAFYAEGAVRNVVRFCFAKRDATLDAALERLAGVVRQAA